MANGNHKTRLELTWIGKENRPRLEPRILLEDVARSHHAKARRGPADQFDNRLIFGDNLLALKAMEAEFAGKIKCICIDPPYNTGSAFEHYDDGIEHSIWLSLMRDRLEILRRLLAEDGTLWVFLDDNEVHYLKVLMDELFGRATFIASIAWRSGDAPNNDAKQLSIDHNTILVYSKVPGWLSKALPRTEDANAHYTNPDNDPNGPWFPGNLSSPHPRKNLQFDLISPTGHPIKPPTNGWRWSRESMDEKIASGEIVFSKEGTRIIRKTYLKNQKGLAPSSLWDNIEETGHNRQAKYELKKLFPNTATEELFATPKPERVIQRILMITTNPDDWVLDSFAGSGTTGAVAHKMGRRWIMVELGEHCHTHIIPRLTKVIDGADPGGVTESTGWRGGGGFRYSRLASSLLEKDRWGNWVISKKYNAAMLAEAVCKLEGFRYDPSPELYWQHGRSTETDFNYVTTQTLSVDMLQKLSDEVGEHRTLAVYCLAFRFRGGKGLTERFPNLTVKKIPKAVLAKCEWGKDDYSLEIKSLPVAPAEDIDTERAEQRGNGKAGVAKARRRAMSPAAAESSLFASAPALESKAERKPEPATKTSARRSPVPKVSSKPGPSSPPPPRGRKGL